MKFDITFLHTSEVHIETFDGLMKKSAPTFSIKHVVKPEYLASVMAERMTVDLEIDIKETLFRLNQDAHVVVCTCSSLGSVAESMITERGCIQRIDRAMADWAVHHSASILVLAALESALPPTYDLLSSSAAKIEKEIQLEWYNIDGIWPLFESGCYAEYLDAIAQVINAMHSNYGVIVLTQASMTKVTESVDAAIPIIICH